MHTVSDFLHSLSKLRSKIISRDPKLGLFKILCLSNFSAEELSMQALGEQQFDVCNASDWFRYTDICVSAESETGWSASGAHNRRVQLPSKKDPLLLAYPWIHLSLSMCKSNQANSKVMPSILPPTPLQLAFLVKACYRLYSLWERIANCAGNLFPLREGVGHNFIP